MGEIYVCYGQQQKCSKSIKSDSSTIFELQCQLKISLWISKDFQIDKYLLKII